MSKSHLPSRRTVLKAAGSAAGLSLVGGAAMGAETRRSLRARKRTRPSVRFKNEAFYDGDGKFDVEKGKDAILTLCRYHGYPIFPDLREKLWVSDYAAGEFTKLGLAACMFVNNEKDRYMMLDLFLLPGQMLPEHWHLEGEKNPAKREGWLVRWGLSHIVGVGEPNLSPEVVVPKCHWGGKATTSHEVIAKPGMFVPLAEVKTRHWQYAGPEGTIVTEVANVHTNDAVRHTDPVMNKHFLGG
ncbi:MAG: cupin domain-containing protein [Planctomycetota bacterium]|jgi:D-lyxose ketol-isomerase